MEFKFKQFSVKMSNEVFKVGTDATLLGAILRIPNNCSRMLEIGTGTGVISLMIAQRYPDISIDAIDISPLAIELTNTNFRNSPFDNLNAKLSDAKSYKAQNRYDVIFSNPPYHLEGTKSSNEMKNRSKSQDNLLLDDFILSISNNLADDGEFWVVAPPNYIHILSQKLMDIQLYANLKIDVKHHHDSKTSRQVVCYNRKSIPIKEKVLVLYKEQRLFTDQAKEILSPYLIVL